MTLLRRVNETCRVSLRGCQLTRSMPGCITYHRMHLGPGWRRAFEAAQELCSRPARSLWERTQDLNLLLDSLDDALSQLERRIIFEQMMGETQ